jgi:predicted 2-oxoglutarate/Fe(II)-dependent dioxygenase YbiX/peroxiredoxin
MSSYAPLLPGDPAPWFRQRCTVPQGSYTFDMSAGRHIVLFFFGSSLDEGVSAELARIRTDRTLFDGRDVSFFGVSADPGDEAEARLVGDPPGIRFFWDSDGLVGRLYGAQPLMPGAELPMRPRWVLLDPMLRVLGVIDQKPDMAAHVLGVLRQLRPTMIHRAENLAPVLSLDHVFEPEFCHRRMSYYHATGSVASGVLTEQETGRSVAVSDPGFKRRRDCMLRDGVLVQQVQARIIRRVVPEIRKAFQFEASRLERLIVACYDSADRGCFGAHRDNTVRATAHRRFAVSINLNDDFEGGEISFPEFGTRGYRPAMGGALIFSCSLMHAVSPVLHGHRYACLPFVYDEEAAKLKQANQIAMREGIPAA